MNRKSRKSTSDPDNPRWTVADFKRARPATAALPDVVAAYRRGRGPQKSPTKVQVTLRLSPDVIGHFKASGEGWQTRIDEALRRVIKRHVA